MPKKPLRPCSHPGCPNLCEGQFCEQHRVEERRKYDKYERSSDVNCKYGRAWKRIRDRYSTLPMRCGFTNWWYSSKNTAASMCISSSRANANRCKIHSFYSE